MYYLMNTFVYGKAKCLITPKMGYFKVLFFLFSLSLLPLLLLLLLSVLLSFLPPSLRPFLQIILKFSSQFSLNSVFKEL